MEEETRQKKDGSSSCEQKYETVQDKSSKSEQNEGIQPVSKANKSPKKVHLTSHALKEDYKGGKDEEIHTKYPPAVKRSL